jgi:anti-sigma factor ChrR (cupin superfamily)
MDKRKIFNIHTSPFGAYDMEGPLQDDMSVLKVSYDETTQRGVYVMRMEPGAETIAHTHGSMEEFIILEGELIESDGTVLKKGDVCSYQPGSHHNSRTETGCVLLGIDWDKPAG